MQKAYPRYKFNLHWYKVGLLCLGFFIITQDVSGQQKRVHHLLDYDSQLIHYGFLMGVHTSKYRPRFNDNFTSPSQDSVQNVIPGNNGGFKLGFVVNFYVFQYLNFRILPTVAFYEFDLNYHYSDGQPVLRELKDATMMELPLILKYKSVRRGNSAMYLVGGINPSLEASGRGDEGGTREKLELKNANLALELGAGFDIYFPLFKFSPEIRYSFGVRNMLEEERNQFSANFSSLRTHNFTVFISFEGSPNYFKKKRKRNP